MPPLPLTRLHPASPLPRPPLPGSHADINWNYQNARRPSGPGTPAGPGGPPHVGGLPHAAGPRPHYVHQGPPQAPPMQRQHSSPAAGGPGLPAHLSMMLDSQRDALGPGAAAGDDGHAHAHAHDGHAPAGPGPAHAQHAQHGASGGQGPQQHPHAHQAHQGHAPHAAHHHSGTQGGGYANANGAPPAAAAAAAAAQHMQQVRVSNPPPAPAPAAPAHAHAPHAPPPGPGVRALLKQAAARLDVAAEMLRCPITREVFRDPVVASDGQTYGGWRRTGALLM